MNILPFTFVSQCKHPNQCVGQCKCYDPNKWPLSNIEGFSFKEVFSLNLNNLS